MQCSSSRPASSVSIKEAVNHCSSCRMRHGYGTTWPSACAGGKGGLGESHNRVWRHGKHCTTRSCRAAALKSTTKDFYCKYSRDLQALPRSITKELICCNAPPAARGRAVYEAGVRYLQGGAHGADCTTNTLTARFDEGTAPDGHRGPSVCLDAAAVGN